MDGPKEGDTPLVSIITACLNNAAGLERAISSLRAQKYKNFEYLIIDGGSTDHTDSIVAANRDIVNYYVSEPDNGIADAWNKGIRRASGTLIGILNSDDLYASDTISTAVSSFLKGSHSVLFGECRFFNASGITSVVEGSFKDKSLWRGFGFVHTTCFVPKSVYAKVGEFDPSLKIALDADFLLRALKQRVPFSRSPHIVYMSLGGVSDRHAKRAYKEFLTTLSKHGFLDQRKSVVVYALYNLYYPLRRLRKSLGLRLLARKLKHFLIAVANSTYQWVPTFTLKNMLCSIYGFEIGEKSYVLKGVKFYRHGNLVLGSNVIINRECLIDNRGLVKIGNNTSISHGCKIYTAGHNVNSRFNDLVIKSVEIGPNVVVFSNCQIQPGVTIGEGAVVLPGSIVTKDVAAFTIVGGTPAKYVGQREDHIEYQNNYPFWYAL